MSFEVNESIPLARFVNVVEGTPLKGTYVFPLRYFAKERSNDPNYYLEVIKVLNVKGTDVAITRGGGLFVRDYEQQPNRETSIKLTHIFNFILCELAFQGILSQPVTDTDIYDGLLIERHANIIGGLSPHYERTAGPFVLLASKPKNVGGANKTNKYWPVNFLWCIGDENSINRIESMSHANILDEISSTLPTLLVAAIYHASKHNLAETILTSWIIIEEIISYIWDKYVDLLPDNNRKNRLCHIQNTSIKLELLLTANVISENLSNELHEARKVRNHMAHRATMGHDESLICHKAMRSILKYINLDVDQGLPSFTRSSGGRGKSYKIIEPCFPFK